MNERKLKQLNIVVLIAVITGIACIVIFAAFFAPKEQNKIRGGRMEKFNESWMKRSYGEDGNEMIDLPKKISVEKDEIALIMHLVPEEVNDDTVLMFKTEFQNVVVMIGDYTVYTYGVMNDQKLVKNAVPCNNIVPLKGAKPGDVISVYLASSYKKYSGELPAVGNIVLKNITETSSLMHLLDTDEIDCFYTDLSSGTAKRSASGAGEVYLNNLVFLGVNHGSYQLYTADVRRAISLALSRSLICSNAYMNHARAAFYPVNTSWEALNAGTLSAEQIGDADVRAADALLSVIHAGTKGETLHYRLLCPDGNPFLRSAAALIAEQLAAVNVQLELEYLAMDAFQLALGSGKFDFYLAEIKLTRNMDLSPFFSGGAASYGMKMDDLRSDTTYGLYRSGQVELSEFLDVFASELPFIPLLYRNGQFCYSRHIDGKVESTEENLFRSIAEWEVH